MLIDKNTYIDLEINEYKNFLKLGDLVSLRMVEGSGCYSTKISMIFRTRDKQLALETESSKTILLKIGNSPKNYDSILIYTAYTDLNANDDAFYLIVIGFVHPKKYLMEKITDSYGPCTSLDVIKQYCKSQLGIKQIKFSSELSTIMKTNENKVVWRRPLEPGNVFLSNTLAHMDIMPSFPLMALTRKNELILKSFDILKTETPKAVFAPASIATGSKIPYLNTFNPKSNKYATNVFSGFGKLNLIENIDEGDYLGQYWTRDVSLATTMYSGIDQGEAGARVNTGFVNNSNVHSTYSQAVLHNVNNFVQLCSIIGTLDIPGYYSSLYPTMLVNIESTKNKAHVTGNYLIDTIEYWYDVSSINVFNTTVHVARDNFNNLENSQPKQSDSLNINNISINNIVTGCRNLRTIVARLQNFLTGDETARIRGYLTSVRYGILSNFSIYGQQLNFNSRLDSLNSIKLAGNAIINAIIDRIIPNPYNYAFKNLALNQNLFIKFQDAIVSFLPSEWQDLVSEFMGLNIDIQNVLSEIQSKNQSKATQSLITTDYYNKYNINSEEGVDGTINLTVGDKMQQNNTDQIIQDTITIMKDNTSGADIPFPVIDLTDAQKLLDQESINNIIIDKTIEELTNKGYLDGIDNIRDILTGVSPMDFNTIDKINSNIGTILYTRYWGAYNSLNDLTDFYIQKCFSDKYKTVGVTKFIDATGGKKIFFAVPKKETGLNFYINSIKVNLDYIETELGIFDSYGNPVKYNIYYTDTQYNSNSVLFECRR